MKEIQRRDFEQVTKNYINFILCYIEEDKKTQTAIKYCESLEVKNGFVKFHKFDVGTEYDILEQYDIVVNPTGLIFKDGKLVKKVPMDNINNNLSRILKELTD